MSRQRKQLLPLPSRNVCTKSFLKYFILANLVIKSLLYLCLIIILFGYLVCLPKANFRKVECHCKVQLSMAIISLHKGIWVSLYVCGKPVIIFLVKKHTKQMKDTLPRVAIIYHSIIFEELLNLSWSNCRIQVGHVNSVDQSCILPIISLVGLNYQCSG